MFNSPSFFLIYSFQLCLTSSTIPKYLTVFTGVIAFFGPNTDQISEVCCYFYYIFDRHGCCVISKYGCDCFNFLRDISGRATVQGRHSSYTSLYVTHNIYLFDSNIFLISRIIKSYRTASEDHATIYRSIIYTKLYQRIP